MKAVGNTLIWVQDRKEKRREVKEVNKRSRAEGESAVKTDSLLFGPDLSCGSLGVKTATVAARQDSAQCIM